MKAGADAGSLNWARAWMCVTFTRGLGPEEVFARYGADPDQAHLLDWDAARICPRVTPATGWSRCCG